MPHSTRLPISAAATLLLLGMFQQQALALLVATQQDLVGTIPHAASICKVKVKEIRELGDEQIEFFTFKKCEATCDVLSVMKGDALKQIVVKYRKALDPPPDLQAGRTYLLATDKDHRQLGILEVAETQPAEGFGEGVNDRILAELVQAAGLKDKPARIGAIEQIGKLRDPRAAKVVTPAVAETDPETAREAVIALYMMKIAPDAGHVMELFDSRMLRVWNQQSTEPLRDANGKTVMVWCNLRDKGTHLIVRGVPHFDYAVYLREGIKRDWVLKDDRTLGSFFVVPWAIQRKECVPELIKLLDHNDKRVRYHAFKCLLRTVDDEAETTYRSNETGEIRWAQYEAAEPAEIKKWKNWWKESGETYMKNEKNGLGKWPSEAPSSRDH